MKAKRICLKNYNCICVHKMKISNSFSVQIKNVNIYFSLMILFNLWSIRATL